MPNRLYRFLLKPPHGPRRTPAALRPRRLLLGDGAERFGRNGTGVRTGAHRTRRYRHRQRRGSGRGVSRRTRATASSRWTRFRTGWRRRNDSPRSAAFKSRRGARTSTTSISRRWTWCTPVARSSISARRTANRSSSGSRPRRRTAGFTSCSRSSTTRRFRPHPTGGTTNTSTNPANSAATTTIGTSCGRTNSSSMTTPAGNRTSTPRRR